MTINNLRLALAAGQVYESVDALADALQAQLASFVPWRRRDASYKPIVSGFIWTPAGPRRVTLMLDTGATHCFICAELAHALRLPVSSTPGPAAVTRRERVSLALLALFSVFVAFWAAGRFLGPVRALIREAVMGARDRRGGRSRRARRGRPAGWPWFGRQCA